ncbi:hypothetical protein LP420_11440 [Massilia sp. B-10]|nr:hypothetical protein LP420_11440 [Massilia sp. B-10]
MSILYGYYNANSGSVLIDGQVQHIRTSHEAIALGIGMVHQHFMLVENFTVLDNVMLGTEGGFKLAAHRAVAEAKLREICARYRLDVDPLAKIEDLSVGAQQRRNSQADLPQRQHPDPRRADRRADGAGNRVAVRDPAPVQGTGQDHHPDHPQAGRNHGDHRPGDRDAQPPRGGRRRNGHHLQGRTGQHDGRPSDPERTAARPVQPGRHRAQGRSAATERPG